jgi:hypothetical protein
MRSVSIALALALGLAFAGAHAQPKKLPKTDKLWTHPEAASFGIERIAILPVATYDDNYDVAKQVEVTFGQVFNDLKYRWISPSTTREILRVRGGGKDSLLKLVRESVLEHDRTDSLLAGQLCALFRCDAVLSLRVDQWERQELEWNQAGKPSTSVRLTASMVDTLGRLAWTGSGAERGEGSYNDPNAAVTGVKASGLDTKPIKAEAGAPRFQEILVPLFTRWHEHFPPPPVAEPAK